MDDENLELFPKAIDAQRDTVALNGIGQVSYYSDTTTAGTPLLLLHSINAAPSAMEVQPLFESFRNQRPVYALDLPGFGASERRDREYNRLFFTDAINKFVTEIIGEECDVVAMSLTSEFVARATLEHQTPFRSLCLISPTGFTERKMPGTDSGEKISKFLRLPLVGSNLFRLLTTKPSIRYFLAKSFSDSPPNKLVDYAVRTTNHPAARFAPYCFITGKLFDNAATENLYFKLTLPVQVLYDQDPNITFEKLPSVEQKMENWQVDRIAGSLGLPHWTHKEETIDAMNNFWSNISAE